MLKNNSKKFVVIANPRSGTTFLTKHLNKIDQVVSLGEIYYTNEKTSLIKRFLIKFFPKKILSSTMSEYFFRRKNKNFFGFKILFRQQDKILNTLSKDEEWYKIVLKRENFIKHYVSKKTAQQASIRVVASAESREKYDSRNNPVHIDPRELLLFHKWTRKNIDRCIEVLKKNNQKYLVVEYSDFLDDKKIPTLKEIYNFLGIKEDPSSVKDPVQKMNSRNLKDLISNYDEVYEYLSINMPEAIELLEDTIS